MKPVIMILCLGWQVPAMAQIESVSGPPEKQTKQQTWSVRTDVLWSENPDLNMLLGGDFRTGRHKVQLSFGIGTQKNSVNTGTGVYGSYRYFAFRQHKHFQPYLIASLRSSKYEIEEKGTYLHQVPVDNGIPGTYNITEIPVTATSSNIMVMALVGYGFEIPVGEHFYFDGGLGVGWGHQKVEQTTQFHNTTVVPPRPYYAGTSTDLYGEFRAGLGYSF